MEENQLLNNIEKELQNLETFEEIPVKRKRGRPRKNKEQSKEEIKETTNEVDNFDILPVSSVLNIVLDRLNLTLLSEFEANALDKSFTKVLSKYIDLTYSDEVNLTIILLIIISTRYSEFKTKKEKELKEKEKELKEKELKETEVKETNG